MSTRIPTPSRLVAVTGDRQVDFAIAKWIKGTEDRLTVELMIMDAQRDGRLPVTDSEGREWTPAMIMEYAIFIGA